MKKKYYIEGHRPKSSLEDEETLIITPQEGVGSIERAVKIAREYFQQYQDLSLTVIFKRDSLGEKEGLKIIFKDNEGKLEEMDLFY